MARHIYWEEKTNMTTPERAMPPFTAEPICGATETHAWGKTGYNELWRKLKYSRTIREGQRIWWYFQWKCPLEWQGCDRRCFNSGPPLCVSWAGMFLGDWIMSDVKIAWIYGAGQMSLHSLQRDHNREHTVWKLLGFVHGWGGLCGLALPLEVLSI